MCGHMLCSCVDLGVCRVLLRPCGVAVPGWLAVEPCLSLSVCVGVCAHVGVRKNEGECVSVPGHAVCVCR